MKEKVADLIKKSLDSKVKLSKEEISKLIEIPPSIEMGDFSFPCFILARELKKSPKDIALELKEKIKKLPKEIATVEAVNGYLNFYLNRVILAESLIKEILSKKTKFGSVNLGNKKTTLI